jgi:NAD(P)-dependent dehydrogenase (short-subunit alcohol dehydrogenase family)
MASSTSILDSASAAPQDNFADISSIADLGLCSGKTVFITGAAAGIGQASAILFAAAGAVRIAIADHIEATTTRTRALKAAVDATKPAPDVIVLRIDVRDVQSIEAGLREVSARWGYVDILINNPGNLPEPEVQSQSLAAKDIESWRITGESHIKGTYSVARALFPLLLQGTDKTVVNVTSIGLSVATQGARKYQLSNQSIASLSRDFVLVCGKEGILVYSMFAGRPSDK